MYTNESNLRKLIITEWLTIIGVCVALFAWSYTQSRIDTISLNERIETINERIDAQNARTDQLYIAFYDLLKEHRSK